MSCAIDDEGVVDLDELTGAFGDEIVGDVAVRRAIETLDFLVSCHGEN